MTLDALTSSKRRIVPFVCTALIVVATLAAYHRLAGAEFTNWDDTWNITENADFSPPTLASLRRMWTKPHLDLYVPLTYTTWWTIDRLTFRETADNRIAHNAAAFHVTNVVLHTFGALLVFALLRRLLRARAVRDETSDLAATVGALLFALHPVQVESIAWVSGLKDLLAGLLSLAAILQYVRYVEIAKTNRRRGRDDVPPEHHAGAERTRAAPDGFSHPARAREQPQTALTNSRRIHQIAAAALLLLAILAKPSAVALPIVLLVIDKLILNRRWPNVIAGVAPMFILSLPFILLAKFVQPVHMLTSGVSPALRPLVATDAIAFYVTKLAWPVQLCNDYGRTPARVFETGSAWWSWALPVVAGVLAFTLRRRLPLLGASALLFVASLVPVLGFVPFDFQEYSTVADHYLYMPMLGMALAAAAGFAALASISIAARRIASVLVVIGITALGVRAFDQSRHWLSTRSLWTHTLAINPESWIGYSNLAQNVSAVDGRYEEAERLVRRSLELRPTNFFAQMVLGEVMLARRDLPSAAAAFEAALRINPRLVAAHVNLANVYGQMGRIDQAIAEYDAALAIEPNDAIATRMAARARRYRDSLRAATRPATTRAAPAKAS